MRKVEIQYHEENEKKVCVFFIENKNIYIKWYPGGLHEYCRNEIENWLYRNIIPVDVYF